MRASIYPDHHDQGADFNENSQMAGSGANARLWSAVVGHGFRYAIQGFEGCFGQSGTTRADPFFPGARKSLILSTFGPSRIQRADFLHHLTVRHEDLGMALQHGQIVEIERCVATTGMVRIA